MQFSKAEFVNLLRMVLIADWVINSMKFGDEDYEKNLKYTKLYKLFLKKAYEENLKECVYYDENLEDIFPTRKFDYDGEVMELIEDYNNDNLWEELKFRIHSELYGMIHKPKYEKDSITLDTILDDPDLFDFVEEELSENGIDDFIELLFKKWVESK